VLYNGNSGWARDGGELGICHGELEAGLSRSPAKVHLIALLLVALRRGEEGFRDRRFRDYVASHNLFRGEAADTGEEVLARCRHALREAVTKMVRLGGREAAKGKGCAGDALGWSRLDFPARRKAIERILQTALAARNGSEKHEEHIFVRIRGQLVYIRCHGIPESLTVPAAREMIGQPFLQDHMFADVAGRAGATRSVPIEALTLQMSADVLRCPCLARFLPQQSEIAYKTVPSAHCKVRRNDDGIASRMHPEPIANALDARIGTETSSSIWRLFGRTGGSGLGRAALPRQVSQMSVSCTFAGPF
jgi:hypothetical protein